jgi:predicted transglutaminase-like cysteine proteinase
MRRVASLWNVPAWTGVLVAGAFYMACPLEPLPCSAAPIRISAVEYVKVGSP